MEAGKYFGGLRQSAARPDLPCFCGQFGGERSVKGAAVKADGTLIWLYYVGNLQLDVNGVPTSRSFQCTDITPFDANLGESICKDQYVVIDYAHAKLWPCLAAACHCSRK